VLAGALTILAMELHELDETEPLALHIAQNLLSRFVGAIRPVEHALESLVEADPSGTLAIVLTCIGSAAAEFEHGHVTFGKMDVLVANAAMAELIE
jgi:NAD(P)-dependent dehydrogenase (short-subunit alcohol dehydrogenase family)